MKVYNQDKTEILTEYDLEKGYLKNDVLFIQHHDAIIASPEQGHYETIKQYSNGSADVQWVVDTPRVAARAAYDEYENIQIYIPYTVKELADFEITELKAKLAATDYQAIKYAEGILTEEEYLPMKEQRQEWRARINELELLSVEEDN